MRGKADSNNWANDSVFIQFTGSQTSSSGGAAWRIGTTSAAEVNLEDCNGCGLSGWGWQDNGYGNNVAGQPIYFASTGWQTVRVQVREDGLSIDQIVLSHTVFLNASPGALKNDTTILAEADGSRHAAATAAAATAAGNAEDSCSGPPRRPSGSDGRWNPTRPPPAARGSGIRTRISQGHDGLGHAGCLLRDDVQRRGGQALPALDPRQGGTNNWANDSVFVQFVGSVDVDGTRRSGASAPPSAAEVNIEDCSGCGVSGWGWQDNGYGIEHLGPLVFFADTGLADHPHPDSRRRPVDRSDRAVGCHLRDDPSRHCEERHHDPSTRLSKTLASSGSKG